MKKLRLWQRLSLEKYTVLAVFVAACSLLVFRLVSLLPGLSSGEQPLPGVRTILSSIWNEPWYLPMHLSQLVVSALAPATTIGTSRLPSVLLAIVLALLAYWLLRRWYGYRLALFGILLLLTAPWFLHVGRLSTADIVFPLGMISVLALAAAWHQPKKPRLLLYSSAIAVGLLLYIPGMIWLIAGVMYIERRNIITQAKAAKKHAALSAAIMGMLLIPLIHALVVNIHAYPMFLGFAWRDWTDPMQLGLNFAHAWQYLFIGGFNSPMFNLGRLPILDIVVSLAFIVGVYLHLMHVKSARTRTHAYLWFVGTLLVALGSHVSVYLLLPIVVVIAIGGIGYLLHTWLKVFPRNPLARWFGIGLVTIVVAFTVGYNLRNYFIAWPNNEATRAAFQRQP